MPRRLVRVMDADVVRKEEDEEGKEGRLDRGGSPRFIDPPRRVRVDRNREPQDETKVVDEDSREEAFKRGYRGLSSAFRRLMDVKSVMKEQGVDDPKDIDYDALYHGAIYAINHQVADFMGLGDERFESTVDDDDNVVIPSLMTDPLVTKPLLKRLDQLVAHYAKEVPGGERLGEMRAQDEESNGSLEEHMRFNRVNPELSHWISRGDWAKMVRAGKRRQGQQALVQYFSTGGKEGMGSTNHPVKNVIQGLDKPLGEGYRRVNVNPRIAGGGPAPKPIQQVPEGAKFTPAGGDVSAEEARAIYEGSKDERGIFEMVAPTAFAVGKNRHLEPGQAPPDKATVRKWRRMIESKAEEEGIPHDQMRRVVPMVMRDVDKHARMMTGESSIGGRIKGVSARENPNVVTPAFAEAALEVGYGMPVDPNCPDDFMTSFLKGRKTVNAKDIERAWTAMMDDLTVAKKHPAIMASTESGMMRDFAERAGIVEAAGLDDARAGGRAGGELQEGASTEAERLSSESPGKRLGTVAGEVPADFDRTTENVAAEDRNDPLAREARRIRETTEKTPESKTRARRDPNLQLIESMLRANVITRDEALHMESKHRTMSNYIIPGEDDMPNPDFFDSSHPLHGKTEDAVENKMNQFMDNIMGFGALMNHLKVRFVRGGANFDDVKKLKRDDVKGILDILGSDDREKAVARKTKNGQRYLRIIESSGIKKEEMMRMQSDLADLQKVAEQVGVKPADFAEAAMSMTDKEGLEGHNAALKMLLNALASPTELSADPNQGLRLGDTRALLKHFFRQKEHNARLKQRLQDVDHQQDSLKRYTDGKEHRFYGSILDNEFNQSDQLREDAGGTCEACHPRHFGNFDSESAIINSHADSHKTPFVYLPMSVPQLSYRSVDGRQQSIPITSEKEGEVSLAEINKFVFGRDESDRFDTLSRNYGDSYVRGIVQKNIVKALLEGTHDKAQAVAKVFGLKTKTDNRIPTGAARLSPAQRVALGLAYPDKFMGEHMREQTRLRHLIQQQVGGLDQGVDVIRQLASGELLPDGKKMSKAQLKGAMKSFGGRARLVESILKNTEGRNEAEVASRQLKGMMMTLRPIRDEHRQKMVDLHAEYGGEFYEDDEGDDQYIPPRENAAAVQLAKRYEQETAEKINNLLGGLSKGRFDLPMGANKGARKITIPSHLYQMLGIKPGSTGKTIKIGDEDRIIRAVRSGGRNTHVLELDRPLEQDVVEGSPVRVMGLTPLAKTRFGSMASGVKDAFSGQMKPEQVKGFFARLDRRQRDTDKKARQFVNNPIRQQRERGKALGAILNAGHLLAPLIGVEDRRELMRALVEVRNQSYVDEDGRPQSIIYQAGMAEGGRLDKRPIRNYEPDKYLKGQLGEGVGTAIRWDMNNRLPYVADNLEQFRAQVRQLQGREPTEEEEEVFMDAQDTPVLTERDLENLMGMTSHHIDATPEKPAVGESMSEREVRRLQHNSHYSEDQIAAVDSGEKKEFGKSGWANEAPSGCGFCGASGMVSKDRLIQFMKHHDEDLRHLSSDHSDLKGAIAKVARPADKSYDEHGASEHLAPHEFSLYACPACDEQHPDTPHQRCASGICPHCHGAGEIDPEDDEQVEALLHGYPGYSGKSEHPIMGRVPIRLQQLPEDAGIRDLFAPLLDANGFLSMQVHRDMVESGQADPFGTEKEIARQREDRRQMSLTSRERAEGMRNKFFDRIDASFEDIEEERARRRGEERERFRRETKTPEQLEDEERRAGLRLEMERIKEQSMEGPDEPSDDDVRDEIESISPRFDALTRFRRNTLEDGYHRQHIAAKVNHWASMAARKGNSKGFYLMNEILDDPALLELHGNPEHELAEKMHELHMLAAPGAPRVDYVNGRFLTERERRHDVFAPGDKRGEMHFTQDELRDFADGKDERRALSAYYSGADWDDEEADELKEFLRKPTDKLGKKAPAAALVRNTTSMFNPEDLELIKTYAGKKGVERFNEATKAVTGNVWSGAALSRYTKAHLNNYMHEMVEDATGQERLKGLDGVYADKVNGALKDQMKQVMQYRMIDEFFDRIQNGMNLELVDPDFYTRLKRSGGEDLIENRSGFSEWRMNNPEMLKELRDVATTNLTGGAYEDYQKFADKTFNFKSGVGKTYSLPLAAREVDGIEPWRWDPRDFKKKAMENAENTDAPAPVDNLLGRVDKTKQESGMRAQDAENVVHNTIMPRAMATHYPTAYHENVMAHVLAESGFGDASELRALPEDDPRRIKAVGELTDAIMQIRGAGHQGHSIAARHGGPSFDDLQTFDAVHSANARRQRELEASMGESQIESDMYRVPRPMSHDPVTGEVRPTPEARMVRVARDDIPQKVMPFARRDPVRVVTPPPAPANVQPVQSPSEVNMPDFRFMQKPDS